tara:strand:+ start:1019 stop:1282 length:264 start_codon:yes stop_codon:yes gene_type:complete
MQKLINVLAVASAAVSIAVVGTVGYVYVNREAIIEDVKEKALGSVMGGLGGAGLGGALPTGANDLASPSSPQAVAPVPSGGLGVSQF